MLQISKHTEEEGRYAPAAGLQVNNANALGAGCRQRGGTNILPPQLFLALNNMNTCVGGDLIKVLLNSSVNNDSEFLDTVVLNQNNLVFFSTIHTYIVYFYYYYYYLFLI